MQKVIARCKLACELESVSMGFTPQLGLDIYEGCVQDDLQRWDDKQFFDWVEDLRSKHGIEPGSDREYEVMALYRKCSEIMGEYAKLFNR